MRDSIYDPIERVTMAKVRKDTHMTHDLLYPNETRPHTLLEEVNTILMRLPFISHVYVFGSLVDADWDRWSDIDMIVVVQALKHTWDVWNAIHQAKPILHHHPLSYGEPNGLHLLGNVFVDESVFHCLDLNILTIYEHDRESALERFGTVRELYHNPSLMAEPPGARSEITQQVTVEEEHIATAIHFTKKHIKQTLRGESVQDDLRKRTEHLRSVMEDFTFDYEVVGGKIGKVAETYLRIANMVLQK